LEDWLTPKPRSKAALKKAFPRLSAVVVTQNSGHALEFCLSSLLSEQAIDEVIIVDNGERQEVASALRALSADRRDVRLLQGHGNVGSAQGMNLGAGQAGGGWLLFVHPEVVLQPGAVDRLMRAGRHARAPAAIRGAVAGRARLRRGAAAGRGAGDPYGEFVLISRSDFEAMRGFRADSPDQPFNDLGRRLAEAGGEVLVQSAALAVPVRTQRSVAQSLTARLVSLVTWIGLGRKRRR